MSLLTPGVGHLEPWRGIATALARGFSDIGVPFDAVCLCGSTDVRVAGLSREITLGAKHIRTSVPALHHYLRFANPVLSLVTPALIAPLALATGLLARRTVVPWEQGFAMLDVQDVSMRKYKLTPALQRATYWLAPVVAAVSDDTARHLDEHVLKRRKSAARTFILPNPIDAQRVRTLAQPPDREGDRFRFCSVGRLARQKGHDLLLRALAVAAPRLGDWECMIAGEGPHREELESLSEQCGLSNAVVFLGHRENPYPLIASADAFIHTARYEPFGVVLLEALVLGCPIVATACPGAPRDILGKGEFGLVVSTENIDALADALIRIRWDTDLRQRLSALGPSRAEAYAPEVIAESALRLVSMATSRSKT